VIEGINSKNNKAIKQKPTQKLPLSVMNNYFSIGADAKITLDFHSAREKDPAAFSSQAINKMKYAEVKLQKNELNHQNENLFNYSGLWKRHVCTIL
jgi:hypothetical protein